jgi:hypothetical protein
LKIFRGGYVLLPRSGMSLKIFRDMYVLLPRAGISYNIFHRSARAQPDIVVAGTTVESAALASVRSVARAQPAIEVAGTKIEGAALAPVPLVGKGSTSHCGGEHGR